jgi:hypothetical protein
MIDNFVEEEGKLERTVELRDVIDKLRKCAEQEAERDIYEAVGNST